MQDNWYARSVISCGNTDSAQLSLYNYTPAHSAPSSAPPTRRKHHRHCCGMRRCQKRPIYMAKRPMHIWQTSPTNTSIPEVCASAQRVLFMWQTRPLGILTFAHPASPATRTQLKPRQFASIAACLHACPSAHPGFFNFFLKKSKKKIVPACVSLSTSRFALAMSHSRAG